MIRRLAASLVAVLALLLLYAEVDRVDHPLPVEEPR